MNKKSHLGPHVPKEYLSVVGSINILICEGWLYVNNFFENT